jgi:hypothetical protein
MPEEAIVADDDIRLILQMSSDLQRIYRALGSNNRFSRYEINVFCAGGLMAAAVFLLGIFAGLYI